MKGLQFKKSKTGESYVQEGRVTGIRSPAWFVLVIRLTETERNKLATRKGSAGGIFGGVYTYGQEVKIPRAVKLNKQERHLMGLIRRYVLVHKPKPEDVKNRLGL